jgi:hypothetical protein
MLNTRKQMADIVTKREEEKRAKEEQQRQQQRTREIAEANKAAGDRGGYQSSWGQDRGGGDFMGGKGTSAEMGSGADGPAGRFSDKRLKENIELIGKSPCNINIYKFNYKNNPTTYQGVMADEVSWASVKHPNGYMMVDYNKIDVEFKKI